jgi:hypothetical protein
LGLRPKPQFLVGFGGEAAKPNQKNFSGRRSRPEPHRRRRTLHQPWRIAQGGCNVLGLRPRPQYLDGFGGFAAKTIQILSDIIFV